MDRMHDIYALCNIQREYILQICLCVDGFMQIDIIEPKMKRAYRVYVYFEEYILLSFILTLK